MKSGNLSQIAKFSKFLIQFWGFKKLLAAIFEKSSILDAWMGYECVSEIGEVSFFYKYIIGNKRSFEKLS